jgi:CRISPR-associated protein Csm2
MRITSFYSEGTTEIKENLFYKTAEDIATTFVHTWTDKFGNERGEGVGRTQLRRLFNEVKRFEQKLKGDENVWKKYFPYIQMIRSKALYNIVRANKDGNKEYYDRLSEFITDGIKLIKEEKDFFVFSALFEAVYGYYYEKSKNFERGN